MTAPASHTNDLQINTILRAAHVVHQRLRSGWWQPIYQEALQILLSESEIRFRVRGPKEGTRNADVPTTEAVDLICDETIMVRVGDCDTDDAEVCRNLYADGLQCAVFIRFGDADLGTRVVTIE